MKRIVLIAASSGSCTIYSSRARLICSYLGMFLRPFCEAEEYSLQSCYYACNMIDWRRGKGGISVHCIQMKPCLNAGTCMRRF